MKHSCHHHSGQFDMELSGPALRDVTLNGSGKLVLDHLKQATLAVAIHGSGDAEIAPIDDADIFIAASGDVRLHTHPKHLNSEVAGSGQIIELSGQQKT